MQRMSEAAVGSCAAPRVERMGRSPDVVVDRRGGGRRRLRVPPGRRGRARAPARSLLCRLRQLRRVRGQRAGLGQGARARAAAGAALGRPLAAARRPSCPTTSSTTARAASSSPRPRRSCGPAPSATACSPGSASSGEVLDAEALRREEPYAAHDLPGGVLYPGDAQLEPRLATAALVRAAVARGAELATGVVVERIVRGADGRATGVETGDRPDRRRHGRRRRRRVDAGAARDRGPDRPGHAAQGPGRRARALARRASGASSARPATWPPSRPTTPSCRSRWSSSRPRPAPRCSAPAASTSASTARSRSPSRARSPAAPRASSRSCATRARCASTPACAR